MSSSEPRPSVMTRVAVVAPRDRLRETLVEIADAGVLEIEEGGREAGRAESPAARLLRSAPGKPEPRVSREPPDLDSLQKEGAWELVAGEAEISARETDALDHGPASVLVGWLPEEERDAFSDRLSGHGASVVSLPRPRSLEPPTRPPSGSLRRTLRPLVETYAVIPYEDMDPSLFAGVTYVLMFGMMFGDVGHGLVLAALGFLLGRSKSPRFQSVRRLWLFPAAAGVAAAVFGLLYGEAFGPTGIVPVLWLAPLEEPVRLLVTALGIGAVLIGISFVIGTVNRWREGGVRLALYAPTGLAGAGLFFGAALLAAAWEWRSGLLWIAGGILAGAGVVLDFLGFRAQAGGGGAGIAEAVVELYDTAIRIFANVVSFGRLAAFGLTHAAIGFAVWSGTKSLWGPGLRGAAAVALFIVGNIVAFSLEALVAGVQALRLEYYELFSRVFVGQGRPFEPWHLPVQTEEPG